MMIVLLLILHTSLLIEWNSPVPGLVHWMPLTQNLTDWANSSTEVGGAGCWSFVDSSWTASCPTTLSLEFPQEYGGLTMCVAAKGPLTNEVFSCELQGFVDCLTLSYSDGSLLSSLNEASPGGSATVTIPTQSWSHLCVVYDTRYLATYLDGAVASNVSVGHSIYAYGTPQLLASEGVSFVNWRVYSIPLSPAVVAQVAAADTP
jgi:hypothetical protein